jgi:cyclopropane fatty-acyl-phospholipid synthase-like methyltransferase
MRPFRDRRLDEELHLDGPHAPAAGVADAAGESDVLAYYVTTPHYLYELSYWEASGDKQAWFQVLAQACRRFGLTTALDFGGGVGGVSLYLRRRGVACDHLDVPSKTSEYARWRFARHGLPVTILDATTPAQ